ncbi:hypothetical protein G6F35_017730 [Rhizopus arrhizus]|nr:hypothetical protein G6F35_017730 [Rhizopus arrhizus]
MVQADEQRARHLPAGQRGARQQQVGHGRPEHGVRRAGGVGQHEVHHVRQRQPGLPQRLQHQIGGRFAARFQLRFGLADGFEQGLGHGAAVA